MSGFVAAPGVGEVTFSGDYASWAEALATSTGYDNPLILERVVAATRRVVAGEAVYERDAVTFDRIEHSLPLLACLLYAASRLGNRLNLVDIGGSLGTSYRQNRSLLSHLAELRWSIVEQPHFVAAGKAEFETGELRFFASIDECQALERPRVGLLCGVMQYVERPYELLGHVLERELDFVILDRTQFFVDDLAERITVERVPERIYSASYPAWFLNLGKFRTFVESRRYDVTLETDSWESWLVGGSTARNRCFLLERRSAFAGHGWRPEDLGVTTPAALAS